jgi:hypothetical protein
MSIRLTLFLPQDWRERCSCFVLFSETRRQRLCSGGLRFYALSTTYAGGVDAAAAIDLLRP